MPKILYGSERSPTVRAVLVTARAVGVHLEIRPVDLLGKKEHKTESFLKMNPAHTVPTLDDDGFYVWESRAIMGYLVSKYDNDDKLYPKDTRERTTVDTILHFDNGSLGSSIQNYTIPQLFKGEPPNEEKAEAIKDRLATLERILSERPYLAGNHVTIADISVVTTIIGLPIIGLSLDPFPNVSGLIDKVKTDLPFYDEVTKKGSDELVAFVKAMLKK